MPKATPDVAADGGVAGAAVVGGALVVGVVLGALVVGVVLGALDFWGGPLEQADRTRAKPPTTRTPAPSRPDRGARLLRRAAPTL